MESLFEKLNQQGVKASRAKRPVINSLKNVSPYFNTVHITKTGKREEAQMNMNANVQTQAKAAIEDLDFGQMRHFTTHFNYVMTTFIPGPRRDHMLRSILKQLETCYDMTWYESAVFESKYPFVAQLHRAIKAELGL